MIEAKHTLGRVLRVVACLLVLVACLGLAATEKGEAKQQRGLLEKLRGKIEYLAEPGALSHAHAGLEEACDKCHVATSGLNDAKCLACHREIEQRRARGIGFHGTVTANCATCHTEHKGRDARIVPLDKSKFDHSRTVFPLKGHHRDLRCEACHAINGTQERYVGTPTQCRDCHADPHGGRLSTDCARCHDERGWREKSPSFDHSKTRFPLTGKHAAVRCDACHKDDGYRFDSLACASCHADPHEGELGQQCESCHSTKGWGPKNLSFDHSKTRFPLMGKHAALRCTECHKDGRYAPPVSPALLEKGCVACHLDPHRGALGSCERCHDVRESWRTSGLRRVDHAKAGFALDETHRRLACSACHAEGTFATRGRDCAACHGDVQDFFAGKDKIASAAKAHPDRMFGAVKCAQCHAPSDRGASTGAILPRCVKCHTPAYAGFATEWMAQIDEKANRAEKTSPTGEERKRIESIRRLAPHNFEFADELLEKMGRGGK